MFHIDKEHQFPDQSEENKGEGRRGKWVDVSLGFLVVGLLGEPKLYQNSGDFTRNGNVVEEICTRIDGCKVVSGQCPTCSVEKVCEECI